MWSVWEVVRRFCPWLNSCSHVADRRSLDTWRRSHLKQPISRPNSLEIISKVIRSQAVVRTWWILLKSPMIISPFEVPFVTITAFAAYSWWVAVRTPTTFAIFHQNLINHGLTKGQIFLIFNRLHLLRVKLLSACARRAWEAYLLTCVEHLHLMPSLSTVLGHLATEGIDFTHADNFLAEPPIEGLQGMTFQCYGRKQDLLCPYD